MAEVLQASLFGDDHLMFGECEIMGPVSCIASELERQVQAYECGDMTVDDSSFSLTKDSGGSSLTKDLGDDWDLDNVSLEELAAADHYGHHICGRQSTADSVARAGASRATSSAVARGASSEAACPAPAQARAAAQPAAPCGPQCSHASQRRGDHAHAHESESEASHGHAAEGESSGVGHGEGHEEACHSEQSHDNMQGAAVVAREEEHMSRAPAAAGLSLSRLRGGAQQQAPAAGSMPRAFSVNDMALAARSLAAAGPATGAASAGLRRGSMYRSQSFLSTDALPADFHLGCVRDAFGSRGRSASLNEVQLRSPWTNGCELLAPQLPPSVDELQVLEVPEDALPMPLSARSCRGMLSSCSGAPSPMVPLAALAGPAPAAAPAPAQPEVPVAQEVPPAFSAAATLPCLPSGMVHFTGQPLQVEEEEHGPPAPPMVGGSAPIVRRKIITSPSPLLSQHRGGRGRQPPPPLHHVASAAPAGSSPKRAKVALGSGTSSGDAAPAYGWVEGACAESAPSSPGPAAAAEWHAPRGGAGGVGGMRPIRSVPANMNTYMADVEVTVRPLAALSSAAEAGEEGYEGFEAAAQQQQQHQQQQPFGRFVELGSGPRGASACGVGRAGGRSRASVPPPVVTPGPGLSGLAGHGIIAPYADGRRVVPSVPKPRKRASPNGNPPRAPAPNPHGHSCTQCGTQTTPVWRAGPHGPKTLCNACGVRYMKVAKGNQPPAPRRQAQSHHM